MATLVLSTVGTVLGGPVGGAIGALIGQSIDQQLLGPGARGPRLGDLGVQSSSYGTQVPRVYGTMRVAGCVVWSTDLVESTQSAGAKGQPSATYSYSVSFAVALSSRRVTGIRRIWADGKLLRGAEGDFKIPVTFRFHDGSEDQAVDALIGSIEGIANTPAYCGLALAVFEDLELAEFGNRIPFLTFEVIADPEPPAIGAILNDATGGAVDCDAAQTVTGYAAYGRSVRAAVEPLVTSYGVDLFDDGTVMRGALDDVADYLDAAELGSSTDQQQASRIQREQLPARSLPAALRLSYYDPARDYQSGEARASASEEAGNEEQRELPAVLSAGDAKALVQQMLARSWAERDKLTLRLPPDRLTLEPGSQVELALSPRRWTVTKSVVEALVAVVELRPSWGPSLTIAADAGRVLPDNDVVAGEASLALLDIPDALGQSPSGPTLLLAATTPTAGWKARPVTVTYAGQSVATQTARRKTIMGEALGVLGAAEPYLIDAANSIDVELVDADQWLTSCDDAALAGGGNLALIGGELIQFAEAVPLGSGRFRLARLLRGRGGTEWAANGHVEGEPFVLVERDTLQAIALPVSASGAEITATSGAATCRVMMSAESVKPPSPVRLGASVQANGDLQLGWTRRSRQGWPWIDEIDAPLGEAREQYRVTLSGTAGSAEFVSGEPQLTVDALSLAAVGGSVTVEVRQIGDLAASRPAQLNITLS